MVQTQVFAQQQPLLMLGRISGYAAACLLFATVLFFMLTSLDTLPGSWHYSHAIVIAALVNLLGAGIRRLLR